MGMAMSIEQLRMHHQHNAALTKVGGAMEKLAKEIRNLPYALSQMGLDEPKMYVVYKEFCDPDNGSFDATNVGIFRRGSI